MTDVFSKDKRKWIMGRVKGQDTKPEILVRSLIHRMGYRFRLHRRDLPGNPDIVLPKHRKIVFVNGCFWHGHEGCARSKRPTSNEHFWTDKLDQTQARDQRYRAELVEMGWRILTVWECEIRQRDRLLATLEDFLRET